MLGVAVVSSAFVAGGAWFIHDPVLFADGAAGMRRVPAAIGLEVSAASVVSAVGWLAILFFGLCALVGFTALLPGTFELTLNAEGFFIRNLYRRHRVKWREVDDFAAVAVGRYRTKIVGFNQTALRTRLARINMALMGRNNALPGSFVVNPEDLARLMALWRARALGHVDLS